VAPDKPQSKTEVVATVEEIEQAIAKLTRADFAKLNEFARNRAQMLSLFGVSYTGEDLLQEAVFSLLEQRRHWSSKKVDFMGVLMGAIRSIAFNLKERSKTTGFEIPASQLVEQDADGAELLTPVDLVHETRLNPEQSVLVFGLLDELQEVFAEDPEALVIMDGWSDRMSGTEIIDALGIDRNAYETIVRRIRRQVDARWPRGSHNVR
jgi:DNA-directed RNA polymerase specialized sigma24 family protein